MKKFFVFLLFLILSLGFKADAMTGKTWSSHEVLKSADLNNQFIYITSKCLGAYSATVSYDSGDIVRDGTTNNFYKSIVDDNLGNSLGNNGSWQFIVSMDKDYAVDVIGTDIDWNLSTNFFKFTSGSPTLTFSNESANKRTISFTVTDTDNGTITWPTNIVWDGGSAPSQTADHLKTAIYEFKRINNITYGKRLYSAMTGSWPYGILGDLTVSGATCNTTLPAGSVYDYNNVTIDSGCTLTFTGNTVNFTILGVKGNLINNGTIEAKSSTATGSASTTTPSGVALSATITQKNGGAGGNGGNATGYSGYTGNGGSGQAQSAGNGGGAGGGGGAAYTSKANGGGAGSNGSEAGSTSFLTPGSAGGYVSTTGGQNGSNGSNAATASAGGNGGITRYLITNRLGGGGGGIAGSIAPMSVYTGGGGGGGGGASKGYHGKNIFIQVTGNITGSGSIDVSGSNGGNGGNGGTGRSGSTASSYDSAGAGGGGGGGGAGGSAGKIYIRYHGTYATPLTYVTTGGTGGTGGTRGNGSNDGGGSYTNATSGGAGTNGDAGSTDVASI